MGLRSAAYICQRITNAIRYMFDIFSQDLHVKNSKLLKSALTIIIKLLNYFSYRLDPFSEGSKNVFKELSGAILSHKVESFSEIKKQKTNKNNRKSQTLFLLLKWRKIYNLYQKRVREKSRECHNHKPQPFPDTKRKRKPTKRNKHKSYKRTKSTKISSLFPKRGNRNAKRTEKHKNKITQGKT